MKIQLIRNATLRVEYGGRCFITDPYLAAKFTRPSFTGKSPNPLVDLPCSPEEVLAGIEMALISHLHSDHFDPAAQELLPKDLDILCQAGDGQAIRAKGFTQVSEVNSSLNWKDIEITAVAGQHGSGAVLAEMGRAAGFILRAANEPSVYWAGDTIWCDAVAEAIASAKPDVILTHSCGAMWGAGVLIVMDAEQTALVCRAAPHSTVVAIHMEALDHATVTRADLRRYALASGIGPDRLLIPQDGEFIQIPQKT